MSADDASPAGYPEFEAKLAQVSSLVTDIQASQKEVQHALEPLTAGATNISAI